MNKKILAVVFIVVLVVGIVVAAFISHNLTEGNRENTGISEEAEETTVPPELRMQYPDRLNGVLETNYEAKNNTIIVTYGENGTLKRIFGSDELMTSEQAYAEKTEIDVNGNTVTLNGKNGKIYTAAWTENYNSYFIELSPEGEGIDENEMAEYVSATE